MKRVTVLLALIAALMLAVAACGGGDDDDGEAGGTGTEAGAECGSGSVSLMGIWVGTEQQSIQAVIDGFEEQCPDVDVKYNAAGDNLVTVLATAVQGGNPPDLATIAQPATVGEYVDKGSCSRSTSRLRRSGRTTRPTSSSKGRSMGSCTASSSRAPTSRPSGTTSPRSRTPVSSRRSRGGLPHGGGDAQGIGRARLLDRRCGRLDAHRPVREHLHPHGGPGEVRPARGPRDSVDGSVGEGRPDRDGQDLQRHGQHLPRDRGRSPDRLPDVGDQRVRRLAESGHGARGRLRRR